MIVDFRKPQREHAPFHIGWTAVEEESFKFLCEDITEDLEWSTQTDRVVKKAQQHKIESILSGFITSWYGSNPPPTTAGLLSQGHQTVKQPSLSAALYTIDLQSLANSIIEHE
jgi:hypothetical protein